MQAMSAGMANGDGMALVFSLWGGPNRPSGVGTPDWLDVNHGPCTSGVSDPTYDLASVTFSNIHLTDILPLKTVG